MWWGDSTDKRSKGKKGRVTEQKGKIKKVSKEISHVEEVSFDKFEWSSGVSFPISQFY